ncbi:MAG: hypothetical protein WC526_01850 [Patescibacteria group bacterium]
MKRSSKTNSLLTIAFALIFLSSVCIGMNWNTNAAKVSVGVSLSPASATSVANTTFLKSYRLLVFTKINGAWPTKDGGYIVSGTTDPNIMFIPPDGFVAKLDKQGSVQWLKLLKTTNAAGDGNPKGEEDVQSIIELKNGGYLMASKVWGFIKSAEWKMDNVDLNKILITKLDKNGNMVWNKSFTAAVEDARNSLLQTADNGFLFYANILDLPPEQRGEDSDVYQDLPFASLKVLKFDKNGNLDWSKNIKNFISRNNDSYLIATPDGGYALAGNVTEPNAEKSLPYNFDTYPGLVKFDKDFNFQWAKSLEGTPLDMAAAIPKAGGGYEMGWKKVRQGASNIRGLIQTQDNGYLVLGTLAGTLSMLPKITDLASMKKDYLIAFKYDSAGNLEWVKKMNFGFNDFTSPMIEFSMALSADKQIMIAGPISWADDDFQEKTKAVNEQDQATIDAARDAYRPGIFMMKMDADLNVSWAKIINPQRGATNYVLKATTDSGAIIAGEYVTKIVKSVILDSKTYYKDGFLLKIDASGNVNNDTSWITDYNGSFAVEMATTYSISNNLTAQVEPYPINLTNRKPEFSLYKKAKVSTYAPFKASQNTPPAQLPTVSTNNTDFTAKKTWPEMNYDNKTTVEPVNEKSRTINSELLPILNQLFDSHVKLTDNLSGQMLSYTFDRVITKDDMAKVKSYLEGLGYKTQDEGSKQLTMYKPGYFLIMTFSIDNINKGFLDVTY